MANRWWTPAAAAAVVLVGAGAVWFGRGDDRPGDGVAPPRPEPAATAAVRTDPAALLVRDGDPVAVSGQVVAVPGRPVRMCAPTAQPASGDPEPPPAYCDFGITVRGLELARLADRRVDGAWSAGGPGSRGRTGPGW